MIFATMFAKCPRFVKYMFEMSFDTHDDAAIASSPELLNLMSFL